MSVLAQGNKLMSSARDLVTELRRRRVFRLLGIYIVGAWVVLQVADLAFQSWGLPAEALRYVWGGALLLFPAVLVFGWRYDITSQGLVRTPDATGQTDLSLKAADFAVFAVLLGVVTIASYGVIVEISQTRVSDTAKEIDIDPNAIAVLPFTINSSIEDTAFFADGIHDDLLTTLANVSSLKVISRTSVLRYRDTTKNMRDIAAELGAANILEGRVQRIGENVRINVQLINATTDEHLWADIYDRILTIDNLFAIQSEITETIASQLATTISPEEKRRINRQPTDSLEAFDAYIKGKHRLTRGSFEALRDAEKLFRRAIEIDPDYALAHASLAYTYAQLAETGLTTVEEMLASGQVYIDRAVEIDPADGYTQAVFARYRHALGEGDSEEILKRALDSSPNNVKVMDIYATFLRSQSRSDEAIAMIQRALEIDPLSVSLFHDLGRSYVRLGRFPEAHEAFERIAQIDPESPYAPHGGAMATILGGQLAEGAHWSDESMRMDPDDFENYSTSVLVYGSIGNLTMAQQRADEALALGPDEPYPLSASAYLLTLQGDREKALAVARAALANKVEDRWLAHTKLLRVVRDAALEAGEYDEALAWYQQLIPEVFEDEPQIDTSNISKAAHMSHLLIAAGRYAQAEKILAAVIERYDELYKLGAANFPLGIAKMDALVLLDRKDEALVELRKLVDDHWRILWRWSTELNPTHDSLRNNQEYNDLVAEIRDDLVEQVRMFNDKNK